MDKKTYYIHKPHNTVKTQKTFFHLKKYLEHIKQGNSYSFFSSSGTGSVGGSSAVALLLSEPVLLSLVPSSAILSTPSCPLSLSSGVDVPSSPFCWLSVVSSRCVSSAITHGFFTVSSKTQAYSPHCADRPELHVCLAQQLVRQGTLSTFKTIGGWKTIYFLTVNFEIETQIKCFCYKFSSELVL